MKAVLILLATLAAARAFAANFSCSDNNGVPDQTYFLKFTLDNHQVQISESTIAGVKKLDTLKCRKMDDPGNALKVPIPVAGNLAYLCGPDGEYKVSLFKYKNKTIYTAAVFEVSSSGSDQIAELTCH